MLLFIAEDDPGVRRAVEWEARGLGWMVRAFSSGEELLSAWFMRRRAVVLCDAVLAGEVDGMRACLVIRLADPRAEVHLMAGEPGVRRRAAALGLPVALVKPFGSRELRAWLGRVARRRGAGAVGI